MKKYIIMLAFALVVASCGHKEKKIIDVTGEWVLSSLQTKAVSIGEVEVDVYVAFSEGSFTLYQKLGEGRYTVYEGTYTLTENILSGRYSDGNTWGASYSVGMDGSNMTLTEASSGAEVSQWQKTTIPDSVRQKVY